MIGGPLHAFVYVGVDSFFVGLLSDLLYQMEILKHNFLKVNFQSNGKAISIEEMIAKNFILNMKKLQSIYR